MTAIHHGTGRLLGAWVLLAVPVLATQTPLLSWEGPSAVDRMGASVAGLEDIDGDGLGDVVVGLPGADPDGRVRVYSGGTGAVLYELTGPPEGRKLGEKVCSLDDVDGDGIADFAVSDPTAGFSFFIFGKVHVFSGVDGALLYSLVGEEHNDYFGWSIASAGDVDLDGVTDLLVGAPQGNFGGSLGKGYVRLHSGRDGRLLLTVLGQEFGELFGWSVDGAGDADGDGIPDLVVGARGAAPGGSLFTGSAYVFSGRDGAQIHAWRGTVQFERFGEAVAGMGDMDGDGRDDVAVGSPRYVEPFVRWGRVTVWSGATGDMIRDFGGPPKFTDFGSSLAPIGDLDGDGVPDLVVGAPRDHWEAVGLGGIDRPGSARVLSGATGETLHLFRNFPPVTTDEDFGLAVNAAVDIDGDGVRDVIVGAPRHTGFNGNPWFGKVEIFSGTGRWLELGFGLQGLGAEVKVPALVADGEPEPGAKITLKLFFAIPNRPFVLFAGFEALMQPFGGGVLVPSPDVLAGPFLADSQGTATLSFPWPTSPSTPFDLFLQAWMAYPGDPGLFVASTALQARAHFP